MKQLISERSRRALERLGTESMSSAQVEAIQDGEGRVHSRTMTLTDTMTLF